MNEPQNTIDYYFKDINNHPTLPAEDLSAKLQMLEILSANFIDRMVNSAGIGHSYVKEWNAMVLSGRRIHKMSKLTGKTQLENATISNGINKEMRRASIDIQNGLAFQNHILACNFNMQVHYRVLDDYRTVAAGTPVGSAICDYLYTLKKGITILQNEIAQANLKLVIKFAKEYQHVGVPLSDLIQEGNIGLMRAIEKFDQSKGLKFTTYAVWWIKQGFLKVIKSNNRLIRIPTHIQETLSRIAKARAEYVDTVGFEPSLDTLATSEGMTEQELETLYNVCMEPISIETVVAGGQAKQLKDFIPDETVDLERDIDLASLRSSIAEALDEHLTEAEKLVIICRFGLFNETVHTLEEIASKMDKSRERIRQLEATAKAKLAAKVPWLEEFNEAS
jgi:RNA polymerase sigma factor (sigma-70 family)